MEAIKELYDNGDFVVDPSLDNASAMTAVAIDEALRMTPVAAACSAIFRRDPLVSITRAAVIQAVTPQHYAEGVTEEELEYFRFLLNDSAWADVFVEKDPAVILEKGALVDLHSPATLFMTASQMLRLARENRKVFSAGSKVPEFIPSLNPVSAMLLAFHVGLRVENGSFMGSDAPGTIIHTDHIPNATIFRDGESYERFTLEGARVMWKNEASLREGGNWSEVARQINNQYTRKSSMSLRGIFLAMDGVLPTPTKAVEIKEIYKALWGSVVRQVFNGSGSGAIQGVYPMDLSILESMLFCKRGKPQ